MFDQQVTFLTVKDLDKSVDFYQDILELPIPELEKPQKFVVELYDFIVEVISCEMVDRTLIIEFVITNKIDDRELDIHRKRYSPYSRIFDENRHIEMEYLFLKYQPQRV